MKENPVPSLEDWQFEKVAEASEHFNEHLKTTVKSEEHRAREDLERRDDWGFDNYTRSGLGKRDSQDVGFREEKR